MASVSIRTARVAHPCVNARHWETDHTINPGETYVRHVAFPGDEGHEEGSRPWVLNVCAACAVPATVDAEPTGVCARCSTTSTTGVCCSAHGKPLCHLCYRRTHFVEVCVAGCRDCAADNLPLKLADLKLGVAG